MHSFFRRLMILSTVTLIAVSLPTTLQYTQASTARAEGNGSSPARPGASATATASPRTSTAPATRTPGAGSTVPTPAPASPPGSQDVASPPPTPIPVVEEVNPKLAKLMAIRNPSAEKEHEPPVDLPRRITIPSIGVDAGFEYVGMAEDGAMGVPKDPEKVAWYQLGPRPGEPGNSVIAGHVDWGGKVAVFFKLRELKAGDTIVVDAMDGRRYEYVVSWQRWYDASSAPVGEVFGQSSATELTLITCGGQFDHGSRQYLSRVVVRATLR